MNIHCKTLIAASIVWIAYCMPTPAAEHRAAIEKYLSNDVVAVGVVDLSRVDPVAVVRSGPWFGRSRPIGKLTWMTLGTACGGTIAIGLPMHSVTGLLTGSILLCRRRSFAHC